MVYKVLSFLGAKIGGLFLLGVFELLGEGILKGEKLVLFFSGFQARGVHLESGSIHDPSISKDTIQ